MPVFDALQTEIDNYQVKVPTPRNSAAQKKTIRQNIKNLFKENDIVLKEQMDKTVVGFKTANPHFVSTYKANRIIIDPGKSTTTLKGIVQSATGDLPISGVSIIIKETGNKATSSATGSYEIKPIVSGIYTVIISASGFKEKTETNIAVKQGQTTTLNIVPDPA